MIERPTLDERADVDEAERGASHDAPALGHFMRTRVCDACGAPLGPGALVKRGDAWLELACPACGVHTGYTRYVWHPLRGAEGGLTMPTTHETDQDLPGMEDRAIAPLEKIAVEYAHIRDARMALNEQEVTLKRRAIAAMKRAGKLHYRHNGIVIEITTEETIKVKIPKGPLDDPDEALRHGVELEH